MNTKKIALIPFALSIVSSAALAASTPNISDAIKQTEQPKLPPKEAQSLPNIGAKSYAEPMKDLGGKKVFVERFLIKNAEHLSQKELKEIVSPYEKQELSFSQIEEVASKITKKYREKGYFVARAYIPKQDMKDGVLEIVVVEGKYGKFKLNNNSLVKTGTLHGILDEAKKAEVVSISSLERAMLIINDTPGSVVTSADVYPGENVGESDFAITADATRRFDGYVLADNYGGKYTGRNKLSFGANVNSLLGIGDKFSINGILSEQSRLKNGKAAYSSWLNSDGLRGEVSVAKTTYSLGEDYKNLDARGSAYTFETKLSYPFIKTRLETLDIFAAFDVKKMKDEIRSTSTSTDKAADVLNLGVNYQKSQSLFGFKGDNSASFTISAGKLYFRDDTAKANDDAGARTSGNYYKLLLELSRNTVFSDKLSLSKSLKLQKALGHKNLDGSEDMSFTGQGGVKAYPEGEYSAETGYLANIELFYSLPSSGKYGHRLGTFVDAARGYAENGIGADYGRSFYDAGIGYYANYDGAFLRAQIAQRLGSTHITSEGSDMKTRFLWQAGWAF